MALTFLITLIVQPYLYFFGSNIVELSVPNDHIYSFIIGSLGGGLFFFLMKQILDRLIDWTKYYLTSRTPFERDGLSDVRTVESLLPKSEKKYDGTKFFKKSEKIFVGLSESKKTKYINKATWRSSHIQIMGTTGSGKGVLAGSLVYQACMQGEAIFAFNPKPDPFFPLVAGTAADAAGVRLNILKIGGMFAQWNPILNRTVFEILEMLAAAFGFGEKGSDADFYRLMDRQFAGKFANFAVNKVKPFKYLVEEFLIEYPDVTEKAPKFKADLLELCSLPFVNAKRGIDIDQEIIDGSFNSIDCSTRNTAVMKAQRAFSMSVVHALERREDDSGRHVLLYWDEFKYLISSETLASIATLRSAGCHIVLAHQSLGDLRNCPADVDAESVVSSVMENCAIKIVYRVNQPETAKQLSEMSGSIISSTLVDEFELSTSLTEMKADTRKLSQTERPLIDTNMWMMLPSRCAVVLGDGLTSFVFTSPVDVIKQDKWLQPTIYEC